MRQHYTGDWRHCGDNIAALLAIGVEVKFRQYWRYDYGWDFPQQETARWQVLRSKAELEAKSGQSKTITEKRYSWPTKERIESYCMISYRIPLTEYPLMRAKYKEYEREERARAAAEWERRKQEYYQQEERKLAEHLEKHPAAANPEGWQENVDYMMANDPEHGEVLVNIGG